MPYVNGKKYPWNDAGKQAAYEDAGNSSSPITDVMSEVDSGPMFTPTPKIKSKLKPYKLNQGLV